MSQEEQPIFQKIKAIDWNNKIRILLLQSRNISSKYNFLIKDFLFLFPQFRKESKLEKKEISSQVETLMKIYKTQYFILFNQQHDDLYVIIGNNQVSCKFQLNNYISSHNEHFQGNNVKYSRCIVGFDQGFEQETQFKLVKELFSEVFNIPNNHPQSKPVIDHIVNFNLIDNQENTLVEIGPRFNLKLEVVFGGMLQGEILYKQKSAKIIKRKWKSEKKNVQRVDEDYQDFQI